MAAGEIHNFVSSGWAELLWPDLEFDGGTWPQMEIGSSAFSLATFKTSLSFSERPFMHTTSLSSSMNKSASLGCFFSLHICYIFVSDPK